MPKLENISFEIDGVEHHDQVTSFSAGKDLVYRYNMGSTISQLQPGDNISNLVTCFIYHSPDGKAHNHGEKLGSYTVRSIDHDLCEIILDPAIESERISHENEKET